MSVRKKDWTPANNRRTMEELPRFELEYLYDDDKDPKEVTIFDKKPEHLSRRWISCGCESVIPLEEVR